MPKNVKNHQSQRRIIFGLFSIAILSLGVFSLDSSGTAYADSDNATINVNVSDGITIRVLDSTATTDLEELAFDFTPTDAGVSATKNAVVEVATSNITGYKLYVQSDWREDNTSSSGAYADTESTAAHTTSLIHTGAPSVTDTIPTNLAASYPYWYYHNNYYTENKVIPAFNNPDLLAELDGPTDSNQTAVPISVGVDTSIVAGTYRNKLVFTAVSNPIIYDYSLTLNANGGYFDALSSVSTETETASTYASQADFSLTNGKRPMKSGYTFLGWSEDAAATTADYVIGDDYEIIADDVTGNDKTLYAVYGPATFYNIYYMQEMTATICQTATKPLNTAGKDVEHLDTTGAHVGDTAYVAQSTLSDIRDGKTYTVRRLADGECWMTDDLQLDLAEGVPVIASKKDGSIFSYTPTSCGFNSNEGCALNGNTQAPYSNGMYFYNFYAATAGVGKPTDADVDVDGSLCPVGWRLPSHPYKSQSKSYGYLTGIYGINENALDVLGALPLNIYLSGGYGEGTYNPTLFGGRYGQYITSVSYAQGAAWMLAFGLRGTGERYFYINGGSGKYNANIIRCVAL